MVWADRAGKWFPFTGLHRRARGPTPRRSTISTSRVTRIRQTGLARQRTGYTVFCEFYPLGLQSGAKRIHVVANRHAPYWANVSKRILPQLIYKGYVLRRERLCGKGLFFVCPTAVLARVRARLGTKMLEYPIASGTITFQAYDLAPAAREGKRRKLIKGATFTTTVEQVAYAFVSPVNLPEMGVYEKAIVAALGR